jgi:hypothetical protein
MQENHKRLLITRGRIQLDTYQMLFSQPMQVPGGAILLTCAAAVELKSDSANIPAVRLTIPNDGNAARTYVVVGRNFQNYGCPIVQASGFHFTSAHANCISTTTDVYYAGLQVATTWTATYETSSIYVFTYKNGMHTLLPAAIG